MRKNDALEFEQQLATLSLAGWKVLAQGNAAPGAGARAAYTVTNARTRRCIISFVGTFGDIRFEYNANSVATDFPLQPGVYMPIDCQEDDTLDFWNTTGGAITVYVMEIC